MRRRKLPGQELKRMRVYLSSTYKDLLEHRRAVYAAIHKAGFECSAMEDYAASDERPADLCLNDVARCDLYVGLFAHRYGYVPEGHEHSVTEQECRKAEECGIPRLIFFLHEETPWLPKWIDHEGTEAGRKLKQLKDELGKSLIVDFFRTPDELATKVLAAIQRAAPRKDAREAEAPTGPPPPNETRPRQHQQFRAPAFTGRAVELQELELNIRKRLAEGGALGFWGLKGTGGIGKSALAAELAERLWSDPALFPGGVLWTNLLEETPAVAAARWLRTYGVDVHDATPAECLNRFHQLACEKRPLIVLDNAQRKDDVKALLVNAPGVVVLVTTRELENFTPEVQPRPVDVLHPDDALSLLGTFAPAGVATEPEAAKQICEQCGYFPLFLRIAGSALRTGEFPLLRDYAAELAKRGLAGLADHDREAIRIFDLSWDKLANATDREVFTACALFPGESFGANFVRAWTGLPLNEARRCLIRLENASLLLTAEGRFRFHDRVRDYAISRLDKPAPEMMPRSSHSDLYLAAIPTLLSAVSPSNLESPFSEYAAFITSEALTTLVFCSREMPSEEEARKEDLGEIYKEAYDLLQQVKESDLDGAMKAWIIDLLTGVLIAIDRFWATEPDGLRHAASFMLGELAVHTQELKSTPTWRERLFGVYLKAEKIVTTLVKGRKTIEQATSLGQLLLGNGNAGPIDP